MYVSVSLRVCVYSHRPYRVVKPDCRSFKRRDRERERSNWPRRKLPRRGEELLRPRDRPS